MACFSKKKEHLDTETHIEDNRRHKEETAIYKPRWEDWDRYFLQPSLVDLP